MNNGVHMKSHFSLPASGHTILSLYEQYKAGSLILRPSLRGKKRSYQRMPWWKRNKKIYLIHSVFEGSTLQRRGIDLLLK